MDRNKTIDYIEFHANDLAAIKQFYNQVFGWEFEDYGPAYTSFKDGRIAGGLLDYTPTGKGFGEDSSALALPMRKRSNLPSSNDIKPVYQ